MEEKEIKVLIFTLKNEYYAANIMEVERILGYEAPTALPEAPEFVEGVINYEGSILPIISLAKKFNISLNNRPEDKIIVVKEEDEKIGIIVNQVSEVAVISTKAIENPPHISTNISKRYVKGLIKTNDRIVIFLNLSEVLSKEEKDQLIRE